jgi:hypothetical protein
MGAITTPDLREQERSELDALLASEALSKAPRQARLLAYLCEEYFNGRADQLKEYTLATEVLGRPPDFDQARDAIVRVEVFRLRKKLREYYAAAGAAHALHIFIQPGHYAPRFLRREESPYTRSGSEAPPANEAASLAEPEAISGEITAVEGGAIEEPGGIEPLRIAAPEPGSADPARVRQRWVTLGIKAGAIALAGALIFVAVQYWRAARSPAAAATAPTAAALTASPGAAAAGPVDGVRIRAGYFNGSYVDRAGNVWQSDRYYSGGEALAQPRQYIARTLDPGMFQTMRSGQFSYDIPLTPGNYELRLYFSEVHYGPDTLSGGGETSRLFDVLLNGQPLLHIFDIIKDAGGNNTADARVFKDVHPAADGKLHLRFQPLIDAAVLNAIEVEPAPPGHINPIRIVAQENSYTDHEGHVWQPDQYARGGQFAVHLHRDPVSGTPDPDLYTGERFGNFDYSIPVPPGRYAASLHFAETYWGTDNQRPGAALPDYRGSPQGGEGSRIFDVYGNGRVLLKDFDIFKEAGGAGRAVVETFHNLEPDGEGKLVFRFVPRIDYACVNAIEIDDESPSP